MTRLGLFVVMLSEELVLLLLVLFKSGSLYFFGDGRVIWTIILRGVGTAQFLEVVQVIPKLF